MAATVVVSSFPHLIRHRLFTSRPAHVPFLNFSLRFQSSPPRPSSLRSFFSSNAALAVANDVAALHDDGALAEPLQNEGDATSRDGESPLKTPSRAAIKTTPSPSLSIKEKKELASHAHSLGKKLKSQQVGKSGVTDTVVGALIETLEANELLKLKIRGTCPGEFEDVVKQLEETTGSVTVAQIGRTVILYRPSVSKMKAEEEKRRRAQRLYSKNQQTMLTRQSSQSRRSVPALGSESRQSWRGRRGVSRS